MRCWLRQDIHKQLCFSFSLGKGVGKETASIWKLQSVILAYNVHYTLNAAYAQIICIYTNLLVNAIVRLSHPQSGYSQGQETFLAPSADKQTCNYDRECSNHHLPLSILRSKGLSRSKMKWWAVFTNLPVNYTYITYIIYI